MKKYIRPEVHIYDSEAVNIFATSNNLSGKINGGGGGSITSGDPPGDIIGDSRENTFGRIIEDE